MANMYFQFILDSTDLKINLSAPGGVTKRLKMLTYDGYAPLPRPFVPCQEP